MPDSKHPRQLSEDFKRQIVELYYGNKPAGKIMAACELASSQAASMDTYILAKLSVDAPIAVSCMMPLEDILYESL